MQKVAKEYMTTMKAAAVQARLKAGQSPIEATAGSICQPDMIQQCFAARDGRLLGLLVRCMLLPVHLAVQFHVELSHVQAHVACLQDTPQHAEDTQQHAQDTPQHAQGTP